MALIAAQEEGKSSQYVSSDFFSCLVKQCSSTIQSFKEDQFCHKLCKSQRIEFLKCHSAGDEKVVHEIVINGEHFVIKFKQSKKNQGFEPDIAPELEIFARFNSSRWSVNYFGHCKDIYAVEPVMHTAGQIFGNDETLAEWLELPDSIVTITKTLSKQLMTVHVVQTLFSFLQKTTREIANVIFYEFYLEGSTFEDKIKFTINLFLMLKDMHLSSNGRILLCDVHLDNFGITKTGEVKIIDADDIFFVEDVGENLRTNFCDNDNDCGIGDFNDCHSHCDHTTKTCSPNVAISNVRSVCNVLLSLVFHEISKEEHDILKIAIDVMVGFSNADAVSLDDELSRIETVIGLLESIKK